MAGIGRWLLLKPPIMAELRLAKSIGKAFWAGKLGGRRHGKQAPYRQMQKGCVLAGSGTGHAVKRGTVPRA